VVTPLATAIPWALQPRKLIMAYPPFRWEIGRAELAFAFGTEKDVLGKVRR
jgi:hypothetical protein